MTTPRTATPSTARAINDRIALELLVERGPLTATQLKEATGLSRPSVSDLLGRLRRGGLVEVVGESGAARRGPNARLYGLVGARAQVAALDVRTDSVTVELADLAGRKLARTVLPVAAPAPDGEMHGRPAGQPDGATIDAVLRTFEETVRRAGAASLHTVVMGAPGLVDPATGALRRFGILPAWHRGLEEALRRRLSGRVQVENEVNLAGIAEHRLGAVTDRDTFVLFWLGAGTGAAVVLDGRLRRGASGGAGEIGFLPVPGTDAAPAATGCAGSFNGLAGSAGVCALARERGMATAGDGVGAAEETVRRAVAVTGGAGHGGSPEPAFLEELARRIALGAAGVVAVLDPGCVVLGGEVGRAGGNVLAGKVRRRLAEMSPMRTEVRASTVEGSPVLGGALLTALDAARRELFAQQ
ncbi:ROK family protein [Streptomyces aidingensis]|uniref:Sugar kinase of the NBD/HSP70 family, may contain an N-terminal HTH domain n=1 Tax=Streptomyces aidingensis TaxID=910347 RepID=A0A1I1N9R5_9ACTN|nr:ROK family protein [Streptomyces aidingensis]SFC90480.1 Sugar kinase of the NBD/HSP70 family, may contain an N-terminal HTH domain [Streptomyces aidingensis]